MALTIVEREYLRLLEPELKAAIDNGEPDRAACFAKAIARLRRKANQREAKDAGKAGSKEATR